MVKARFYVTFIRLVGNTLIFDDGGVEFARVVNRSCLGLVVYPHKAEAGALSLSPLEVIKDPE